MEAARIIKKYPNRRLYDTVLSRYVTLDEVKGLILTNVALKIIDENARDITNYVLLQILSQEENSKPPLLTKEILQHLIRFYGHPLQKTMTEFLTQGLSLFLAEQASLNECLANTNDQDEENKLAIWQAVIAEMAETIADNEPYSEPES
jgi:polyhydroxyalkanoate synthesis repressor PhaR